MGRPSPFSVSWAPLGKWASITCSHLDIHQGQLIKTVSPTNLFSLLFEFSQEFVIGTEV